MPAAFEDANLIWDLNRVSIGLKNRFHLFSRSKDNLSFNQRLKIDRRLKVHRGCVNTICWNDSGHSILSGSDDQHLVVTDPFSEKVLLDFRSAHRANIFNAKFLPGTCDSQIVSCSGDGMIYHTTVNELNEHSSSGFKCHEGAVYEILTVGNDSHSFLTCGEDGMVRWFDLRTKQSCNKEHCIEDVIVSSRRPVMSMAVNPVIPFQLAIGCSDNYVRLYDRRMLATSASGGSASNGVRGLISQFSAPTISNRCHRITSVMFSEDGSDVLVSYSADHIFLFDIKASETKTMKGIDNAECSDGTETSSVDDARQVSSTQPKTPQQHPPMKRLRLRGDWSDTGPAARPESDRSEPVNPASVSVMQRMSDMLTRWLDETARSAAAAADDDDDDDDPTAVDAEGEPDAETTASSRTLNSSDRTSPQLNSRGEETVETLGTNVVDTSSNALCGTSSDVNIADHTTDAAGAPSMTSNERLSVSSSTIDSNRLEPTVDRNRIESTVDRNRSESTLNTQLVEEPESVSWRGGCDVPFRCERSETAAGELSRETATVPDAEESLSQVAGTQPDLGDQFDEVGCQSERRSESDISSRNPRALSTTEDVNYLSAGSLESASNQDFVMNNEPAITTETVTCQSALSAEAACMQQAEQVEIGHIRNVKTEASVGEDIDRQMAAIQLQNIFRRRRVERQNEQVLRNLPQPKVCRVYKGHRNSRTMIKKATFWGTKFVMSGSDCGHIFVWDRDTGDVVMLLEGDKHVVNCLQPHPYHPILASSGIDHDVKIWMPTNEQPAFDESSADEVMERNRVMLEETQNTVTVPATFMLRMLASMSRVRRENARRATDPD